MLRQVSLEEALTILLNNKDADIKVYSPLDTEPSKVSVKSLRGEILNFSEGTIILTDAEPTKKSVNKTGVKRGPYKKKAKPEEENSGEKKNNGDVLIQEEGS